MTENRSRTYHRFCWLVCGLLVCVLCVAVLLMPTGNAETSLAASLVTGGPDGASDAATSIGSEVSPAVVDGATDDTHALDPALRIARDALARFESTVDDYTGIIIKRERISGSLSGEARMEFKIRTRKREGDKVVRPLQVYLKFIDPWLSRGREVIWSETGNEGKLIAHEGGLKNVMRVSLAPNDSLAMMGNKYPITEIGMAKLIEKLIEKGERDKKIGPCQVKISDGFEVAGRKCQRIEVSHAQPDPRYDFHIAQIFIDTERQIPLRYAAYLWPDKPDSPPPLEEEYTYTDVRLNVGLKDIDFDPANPAYKYP